MGLFVLTEHNNIANMYLHELRDTSIQVDSMRFRTNLKRLASLLCYEVSKILPYTEIITKTPLATTKSAVLAKQPILLTILRAGMPMLEGAQLIFDKAPVGMIGAYRAHKNNDASFDIQMDYLAVPEMNGGHIILLDTMLATGKSIVKTIENILKIAQPVKIIIVSCIAAAEGIQFVLQSLPQVDIYVAAIDPVLNDKAYIVPGLGDAGDLAYGVKL